MNEATATSTIPIAPSRSPLPSRTSGNAASRTIVTANAVPRARKGAYPPPWRSRKTSTAAIAVTRVTARARTGPPIPITIRRTGTRTAALMARSRISEG